MREEDFCCFPILLSERKPNKPKKKIMLFLFCFQGVGGSHVTREEIPPFTNQNNTVGDAELVKTTSF